MDETPKSWRAGPLRIRVSVTGKSSASGPDGHRERLTTDRIVDAALELMRESGYDAVSMRSVAKALGTGPASLYAHVANKQQLDQLVVDRISQQVEIPVPDPDRWAEQIKEMMRSTLGLFRQYPGSARASMGQIPTEPGSLRTAEGLMSLCRAGGIPDQIAAWSCDTVALYVGATAVEESIWTDRANAAGASGEPVAPEAITAQVRAYFESLPVDEFPLLSSLAATMTSGAGDDRFEFGLSVIVAGMQALAEQGT